MKIVFDERFYDVYTHDPAASPGRLECIVEELRDYEFVEPSPASESDILLVHTPSHLEFVKTMQSVYEISCLSAGSAIRASEIAFEEPAFSLARPPGHHASPNSSWGFCYFNNIAISVRRLIVNSKIEKAVIVDFDLHYGDGTANTFEDDGRVKYYHMPKDDIDGIVEFLEKSEYDIIAVSAGFDKHVDDWGSYLMTEDYREIGKIIREFSERCDGRRYAVLEGGYSTKVLGKNVKAFIRGFE
ncbi:Deacetylase [Archaeoglobus sulfaticallidus PM70-1]|uniref:Deacetylase n=1 Tax=Archaeoglobus sulfaticallidus PM70-1 TaxID=387631 RepID=N0BF85_9EURY|nr:histone deacetylase family protein [Archaeoglobus sulfaticallidus]AGK61683.1 Deacetylase [Archaeoglobus sulfaticallidus PM70-1]